MLEHFKSCFRRNPNSSSARSLARLLAVAALGCSTLASAVGLGDITLHSSLGQPLNADIELIDSAGLEEGDLSANLASADEFSRAGVDRIFFLNDLRFTPMFRGGRKVIHVASTKAVTEPYLSFLVHVNRPGGQLLREFTVLLDPPGITPLAPALFPTQASGLSIASAPAASHARPAPAKAQPMKPLPPATPAAPAPQPATVPTEQLASTELENQQLQKDFEALQARLQSLEGQVADKDKQVVELKSELADAKAPRPVAPVAKATAVPISSPAQVVETPSDFPWLMVLAGTAVVLLAGLLLIQRHKRRQALANEQWLAEQADVVLPVVPAVGVVPAVAAVVVEPEVREAPPVSPAVRREAAPSTDALDGASIYIAYGRFNEALGILDEGLSKEPERTDLRVRKLEVFGQQGRLDAFEQECQTLLAMGFSAQKIDEIRARYPRLARVVEAPVVAAPPMPTPEVRSQAPLEPLDEFQLNLDELSMDTDWDLVSPFETTVPMPDQRVAEPDQPKAAASNLDRLPEVFEIPDEQFLRDFTEDDQHFLQPEEQPAKDADGLDDAFLDNFIAGADLPELDALTVDFDALDSQQISAEKLEQAQSCIELGDLKSASDLLHELLRDGDESCQQAARQLLSRIA